jgi:hypothetical protein
VWGIDIVSHTSGLIVHMDHPRVENGIAVATIVVLQLGACVLLWLFPNAFAGKLLTVKETPAAPSPRLMDWQMLGVVCVGLWALTRAVPEVVYWAILLNTWIAPDFPGLTIAQRARIAATVVDLGFAVWLVFGARSIATYLFGVRKMES